MYELSELLTQTFLRLRGGVLVGCVVEAGCGDFGGEPVGFGEADGEGDEVVFDLLLRELLADFVERFYGLDCVSQGIARSVKNLGADLVPHKWLFDGSEVLQG